MTKLKNKKILITGATRGIGRAMALRFAKDGAYIGVLGKTSDPHPKLEGTIHSVAKEVEDLGGKAVPLQVDLRDKNAVKEAVNQFVSHVDGLDILVNNAGALNLKDSETITAKEFDLIMAVNVRATLLMSQMAIPYLKSSDSAQILSLSPPLNLESKWIKDHLPYTISKFGMSLVTLGLSQSLHASHVRVNSLWPKTTIATAAVKYNLPPEVLAASRKPQIMADAAYHILNNSDPQNTGHFYIDEEVLRQNGVSDFSDYAVTEGVDPFEDIYIS